MAGGSPAWQKKYSPHNVHKPSIKGSTKTSMIDRKPSEVENRQHKGESKALNPSFLSEGPQCGQKGGSSISSQLVISQLQRGAESFKEEERQRRWPPLLPGHCPPVSSPVRHLQIMRPIEITCGFNLPQTSDTVCPIPPKKQPDLYF